MNKNAGREVVTSVELLGKVIPGGGPEEVNTQRGLPRVEHDTTLEEINEGWFLIDTEFLPI